MGFWKTVSKIERIRFIVSLLLVGVLFIVVACFAISQPKKELSSTEGTITSIVFYLDSQGEESQYVYVRYTDRNGVTYDDVEYPSYSSSMKEGDTVTVLYDPASPKQIQAPGGEYLPYIFLAIGVVCVAVSIYQFVTGAKKKESNSPFNESPKQADPALIEQIKNDNAPMYDYYFHWTGKLNQSYILETPERRAIYEAICDHIGVFTPYRFTFANRKTGVSTEHKISHTVTKRYGSGGNGLGISAVSDSEFKIDDVNNWDYLARLGYSIQPKRSGIKLNFDVLHYGVPVAYLEAAGVNILSDDKKSFLGEKLPGNGLYKVSCKDSDLEGVFWACFCASRVEFF